MTQEEREMKANEAPEKIYINSSLEDRIWLIGKGDTSFIEYTRTDAFIEKATEWLKNNVSDYAFVDTDKIGNVANIDLEIIQDFKKYMKRE